jgi:aminocarboxymuconate-semialdehyde decarboxylase
VESIDRSAIVDVHTHTVPLALLEEVARRSEVDGVTARKGERGWTVEFPGAGATFVPPFLSRSAVREEYRGRTGIDGQLLSAWDGVLPTSGTSAGQARSWARRVNQAVMAEADGAGPGTLATVALDDPAQAAKDLESAVVDDGMAGLIFSTNPPHCRDLADRRLDPLWDAAAGLGVPVLVHPPSIGPAAQGLPDSADYANAYCRLVDTTFAFARLILSGVLDRFPQLRLITVHGGGFLPYQGGRLDGAHRSERLASYPIERDRPSDYFSDLYFDTVTMTPDAIRYLVDTVGAEQVLLGTDCPFPLADPQPVERVREADLGADTTTAVLGGNITRLLTRSERA